MVLIAVKFNLYRTGRNKDRFPPDFMFQLTKDEFENLIS